MAARISNDALREEFKKDVPVIYDKAGKIIIGVVEKIQKFIDDTLGHSHHVHPKNFYGKDILIDEIATDSIGHRIKLTVLWAPPPGEAMKDMSFENSGKNATTARKASMACIDAMAKYYYEKK